MDPLFVIDSHQALSRQYFLDKVKFIFHLCGYDPTLYNGHSFRSGTATSTLCIIVSAQPLITHI
jgi:hypothetical protein